MKLEETENKIDYTDLSLLLCFNNRDKNAFAELYSQFFKELYYYARKLFVDTTVDAEDLVQEVFVNLWMKKSVDFVSFDHIKNYLYLSIKNKHKDYIIHKKYVTDYEDIVKRDEDFYLNAMVESEVVSALGEALSVLPTECAKVFKLHVEGWDVKSIAAQLNKSESTVYQQKSAAISILKKRLRSDTFLLLINFF